MIRVDLGQDSSRGYVGWVIGCGLILKVVEAHKYGLIVDCLESLEIWHVIYIIGPPTAPK